MQTLTSLAERRLPYPLFMEYGQATVRSVDGSAPFAEIGRGLPVWDLFDDWVASALTEVWDDTLMAFGVDAEKDEPFPDKALVMEWVSVVKQVAPVTDAEPRRADWQGSC
jgi:hypothetical protein